MKKIDSKDFTIMTWKTNKEMRDYFKKQNEKQREYLRTILILERKIATYNTIVKEYNEIIGKKYVSKSKTSKARGKK